MERKHGEITINNDAAQEEDGEGGKAGNQEIAGGTEEILVRCSQVDNKDNGGGKVKT